MQFSLYVKMYPIVFISHILIVLATLYYINYLGFIGSKFVGNLFHTSLAMCLYASACSSDQKQYNNV